MRSSELSARAERARHLDAQPRLSWVEVEATARNGEDFGEDVRNGLTADPKRLSCAWLYDEKGSALFEDICELPEYYPTRAEHEILATHQSEILAGLSRDVTMVELGSGSSTKTRLLIEARLAGGRKLRYVPIDISHSILEESARALLADYPDLEIIGVCGEYGPGLHAVHERVDGPMVVLWLGSSVGNLDRASAKRFLGALRKDLDDDDRFLIGVDLRKDRETLERAYDDEQGVTARFNLNLLDRIDRELGGDFDLSKFRHVAEYDERVGRVDMFLESLADQRVRVEALDLDVEFAEGERIHTESSYKYSRGELLELAGTSGFEVEGDWTDAAGRFAFLRLRPV